MNFYLIAYSRYLGLKKYIQNIFQMRQYKCNSVMKYNSDTFFIIHFKMLKDFIKNFSFDLFPKISLIDKIIIFFNIDHFL
jgi:hypothetical protein